jgi:hypothetical protein
MSGYRSEASSRSAVKTELTSAHLECLLIGLTSGLFVAAAWMQTTAAPGPDKLGQLGSAVYGGACQRLCVPVTVFAGVLS